MPISGKIVEVNESLNDDPENVNSNPYESGWMVKIELSANAQTDSLLDSKSYLEMIG
jgi:glycine cleavage system H protein